MLKIKEQSKLVLVEQISGVFILIFQWKNWLMSVRINP